MDPGIAAMQESDLPECLQLWESTDGVGLNESDTLPCLARFLKRNPNMSFVARSDNRVLIGAVLCGHDGRRGYLHHLAVDRSHRGNGIGRSMVECCLDSLHTEGISRCNIYVLNENPTGQKFWAHLGWQARTHFHVMQREIAEAVLARKSILAVCTKQQ